jgi:phosphodiesterase/alkaline phosphatase D-like protein/uncharacterized protein YjiK
MKKTLTLFLFTCLFFGVQATVSRTVATTAGNLATDASVYLTTVTDLTVTGTIDARDFKTMRDNMPLLATLDLSGATIVEHIGTDGTASANVTYPANEIPKYAFCYSGWNGKTSLTSISLPTSTVGIEINAFEACTGLRFIDMPASLNYIRGAAFYNCPSLTSMTIPASVTAIENNTFSYCTGLRTVTIPASVTSIGSLVFEDCSGITSISILAANPATLTLVDNFNGISTSTCTLHVPVGTKALYAAADQWKAFMSNIVEDLIIAPAATTTAASSVTSSKAILNGTVNAYGASTDVTFEYGFTTGYGHTLRADQSPVTGTSATAVSYVVRGLTPNSTYHYRAVGVNTQGTTHGGDMTFKTLSNPVISVSGVTAGGLSAAIAAAGGDLATVTSLTVTGTIDASDFKTMRDAMPELATLDISGATIAEYTGTDGTVSENITYPANEIPQWAFSVPYVAGKTSLTTPIVLPASVTSIGFRAFSACTNLTGITFGSSLTNIGDEAFSGCSKLSGDLIIPNTVTTIGYSAFWFCTSLNGTLSIGTSVTTIGDQAFQGCSSLNGLLTIPSSITDIGNYAFSGCRGFTGTFTIPSSVAYIGDNAFQDCSGFTGSLTIPSSLTRIRSYAFDNCSDLTGSLTIPSSVTDIGFYAFQNCTKLTSIKAYSALPSSIELGSNVFFNIPTSTCMLHVPAGTKDAYAAADQWKDFMPNIIEDLVIAPAATTTGASAVTSAGAILNATVNAYGTSTAVTFEYGLTSSYGGIVTAAQSPVTGTSATAVTAALTGLTPNTTYHYRVVGVNTEGTTNGDDMTFITTDIAPSISYASQTYTVGTAIAALMPTNTGGAVPAVPQVSTLAGSGNWGSADGLGTAASFDSPFFLAPDAAGNIYVSDNDNNLIRKITPSGGVSTLADAAAGFNQPTGIAVDPSGNVYVADNQNHRIRKITPAGVVSTLAGSDSGEYGNANGVSTAARFSNPVGLTLDAGGNLYVADAGNHLIRKITRAGEVSTFAGSGTQGSTDGNGTSASFNSPQGIAIDADRNLYITEDERSSVRKITPTGDVTTLAGVVASSSQLSGIAVDASANLYVTDVANNLIGKISPAGDVTILAGSGSEGADNGAGTTASFSLPYGITVDASGNVYVADAGNDLIRKITQSAYTISPALPAGLSFDGATGTISGTPTAVSAATAYTVSAKNNGGSSTTILNITIASAPTATTSTATSVSSTGATLNGSINANSASTAVTFEYGLTSSYGAIVTAAQSPVTGTSATAVTAALTGLTPNTTYHYRVVGVNTEGTTNGDDMTFITTDIAPSISYASQTYTVGTAIAALMPTNTGGAVSALTSAQVSTFAGSGAYGSADGLGTAASFKYPAFLTPDAAGNLYVSDNGNNLIRKITPTGDVSTFAGVSAGFNKPCGIAVDPSGNVYVADNQNYRIRKITPAGVVSTLAGSDSGERGNADGVSTAARFSNLVGLILDAEGNLYVADAGNHLIRKITRAGEVSTFAGSGTQGSTDGNGTSASFNTPEGIAIDAARNLYITEDERSSVRKITPAGDVTTLAGVVASSSQLSGIAVDASANIYVADVVNNLIGKISPAGDVTILAGSGSRGVNNGAGETASFRGPMGITVDASGNLYVADTYNNLIRKITQSAYTISPALPAGLSFDGATGTISGTPAVASAATTYTVTAANSGGRSTAFIMIEVKSPQTITFAALPTKTYGDATFDLAATSTSGLAVSYSSDNRAVARVSGTTVVIVGTGTANITASQTGDATNFAAASVVQQLTVSKKALTVTAATDTKTYDGTTASSAAPVVETLVAGDVINVAPTQAFDNANAVTMHVLTASGLTIVRHPFRDSAPAFDKARVETKHVRPADVDVTGNYEISYVSATGTINKKALSVTATADIKTYDGTTASGATPVADATALVDGDAINVAPTQVFDNANAGTNALTASGLTIKNGSTDATGNYEISYATAIGTINKLGVSVTAVADTKTYDGTTVSAVVPTVGALATGDAINVAPTQVFDNANAGTNAMTASGLTIRNGSTDATDNYEISYATAIGTINKLGVSVTAVADTKTYDGTTVSAVVPTVGVLATVDAINVAPTQVFDNANAGTNALTASGLTIKNGSTDATGNYEISYVTANGSITAKLLTIATPTVTLSKVYDGNTVAAVTAGTLSGVVPSDDRKVTVTAQASYDNATVGTNKTITVVYTLGGSAAGNYSVPADFVATGAEIASGNVVLGSFSNPAPNPTSNGLVLSYNVVAGGPTQYKITFEAAALAVGIKNVSYTVLATTGADGSISITVPEGTRPGKYKGTLQMRNDSGVESTAYEFILTVNIPTEYLAVKYNRVLVLDNSTRIFKTYQWYKDGVAIEGATKQYYEDPKGLVGTYTMQATTTDGEILYSYPKVLSIPLALQVTAYPTMVKAGQTCTVEITDEAMELDLTGADLSVYSSQGIRVYHSTKVEKINTVKLPIMNGVYSGRVTTADGQSFLFKVIVAN